MGGVPVFPYCMWHVYVMSTSGDVFVTFAPGGVNFICVFITPVSGVASVLHLY
jgi:hypothetical protein